MKRLPKLSGLFCTVLLALAALAVLTTHPAPALAQTTCGVIVGMSKSCDTPKLVGENVDCTITLTNNDACGNTYQINSGSDLIHASGGDVNDTGLPISATLPGTPASGTPCAVGDPPTLPCTVAPGGTVTFRDNDYTTVSGDVGALNDQGTINMTDLCDNDTNGCSSSPLDENASASTTVQSCSVTIDKQISCDEGATWTNADAADTGVVTGTCTGFTGDAIWVRYVVHNSGDVTLSCNVHDVTGTTPSSTGGTEYTQDYSTGLDSIVAGGTVTTPQITVGSDGSTALACDSAGPNNDTAQVDCTCGGTSVTTNDYDTAAFSCESCSVQIDKQVNCASAGYVDVFSSDDSVNGDTPPTADTGVFSCTGFDAYTGHTADNIAVQYVVTNTGDDDLENCTTGETNTAITGSATITGAPASITSGASASTVGPFNNDCSPSLIAEEVGGQDTATIGCDCAALENNTKTRSVGFHDTAGFDCKAPGLNVTKVCDPQSGGVNNFTIDVSNSGGVDLTNCNVTDAYEPGVDCPTTLDGSAMDASSSLSPAGDGSYSISAGNSLPQFSGSISGLTANACNQASVTCDITGTAEQITQTSQDTCEVAFGCETRTPGYWKTHPEVSYSVMQAAGGAIQSCGLNLDNVMASQDCSAIEDMCSLGKDAAKLGIDPTQANLIFQCAAAELNLAVTQQDGGNCGNTIPNSTLTFEQCCGPTSACAMADTGNLYACQQAVSAFNAQYDTVTLDPGSILNTPGANSSNCREANGNLFVNDQSAIGGSVADCGGARTYLQKSTGGGPGPASTTNNGKHKGQNK